MANENKEKILTVIAQIPKGKVASYGQIAKLAGIPNNSRQVGQILRDLSDPSIPWHRVVNSKGEISTRTANEPNRQKSPGKNEGLNRSRRSSANRKPDTECESIQREALLEEKVEFDAQGRVVLAKHQWNP